MPSPEICDVCCSHTQEQGAAVEAFAANVSSLDALVERVHSLQTGLPPTTGHHGLLAQQNGAAQGTNAEHLTLQPSFGVSAHVSGPGSAMDNVQLRGQAHAASLPSLAAPGSGWEASAKALSAGSRQKTGAEEWLVTSSDDGHSQPGPEPANHAGERCLCHAYHNAHQIV